MKINIKKITDGIEKFDDHAEILERHIETFKKNQDTKAGVNALKELYEALHNSVSTKHANRLEHFVEKARELFNKLVADIKAGVAGIEVMMEHVQEILAYVETTAAEVQGVVAAVDPKAGAKLDKALNTVEKVQTGVQAAQDVVETAADIARLVQGKKAAAAEEAQGAAKPAEEEDNVQFSMPEKEQAPIVVAPVANEKTAEVPTTVIDAKPEDTDEVIKPEPLDPAAAATVAPVMSPVPEEPALEAEAKGGNQEPEVLANNQDAAEAPDLGDEFTGLNSGEMPPAPEATLEVVGDAQDFATSSIV
jgi:hypothetical protein